MPAVLREHCLDGRPYDAGWYLQDFPEKMLMQALALDPGLVR